MTVTEVHLVAIISLSPAKVCNGPDAAMRDRREELKP